MVVKKYTKKNFDNIADVLREKTGSTEKMSFDELSKGIGKMVGKFPVKNYVGEEYMEISLEEPILFTDTGNRPLNDIFAQVNYQQQPNYEFGVDGYFHLRLALNGEEFEIKSRGIPGVYYPYPNEMWAFGVKSEGSDYFMWALSTMDWDEGWTELRHEEGGTIYSKKVEIFNAEDVPKGATWGRSYDSIGFSINDIGGQRIFLEPYGRRPEFYPKNRFYAVGLNEWPSEEETTEDLNDVPFDPDDLTMYVWIKDGNSLQDFTSMLTGACDGKYVLFQIGCPLVNRKPISLYSEDTKQAVDSIMTIEGENELSYVSSGASGSSLWGGLVYGLSMEEVESSMVLGTVLIEREINLGGKISRTVEEYLAFAPEGTEFPERPLRVM